MDVKPGHFSATTKYMKNAKIKANQDAGDVGLVIRNPLKAPRNVHDL
jgi:hypothetical protein